MSAFVDSTLLRFAQDPFVSDLLNSLGAMSIVNAMFDASDIAIQSATIGPVTARSYKIPAFETVRSNGTDERIVPSTERVRKDRTFPRFGRLDWVDVAFDATIQTKVQQLVARLQSVTSTTLEAKLGGVLSLDDLRTKLLALYAPSVVDDFFAKAKISTFDDFTRQRHLFIELLGATPPTFDPNDPAAARDFTVSMRVKIVDGFDVAGSLQAAKLCRDILEHEANPGVLDGVERMTSVAMVTLFQDSVVTDASIPGMTAAAAKTAVQALFAGERMFAQFVT
jgi:hypothetical protein